MKRFLGRVFFFSMIAALWIGVAGLLAEGGYIWKWRGIERDNPFIQSRRGGSPWPLADGQELASEFGARFGDAGCGSSGDVQDIPSGSIGDPRVEMLRRAAYFAQLDKPDRDIFSNTYNEVALVFDTPENPLLAFAPFPHNVTEEQLERLISPDKAAMIREGVKRILETGQQEYFECKTGPDGNTDTRFFYYPLPQPQAEGGKVAVFMRDIAPGDPARDPNSPWDRDYFIYKKFLRRYDERFSFGTLEEFCTNNAGFRDRDIVVPRPEGVYRIVCVGASTTWEGPSNAFTYPNILEAKLNERFGAGRFDVINCGISGLNRITESMRIPDYLALEPNMIVYYGGVNDICHELFPTWVNMRATRWQKILRKSRFVTNYFNRWLVPSEDTAREDMEQRTLKMLRTLHQACSERGIKMAVCSFASPKIGQLPPEQRAYYDHDCTAYWGGRYVTFATYCRMLAVLNGQLKRFCEEWGVVYIPVAEQVQGGAEIFGDICHMRDRGIEKKAQAIFDTLTPQLAQETGQQ